MENNIYFDDNHSASWQVDIGDLSKTVKTKLSAMPVLRYGDTSPYKCYLLHEKDGYYTVLMENGYIIHDVAGWFRPWGNKAEPRGGVRDGYESKPAYCNQSW